VGKLRFHFDHFDGDLGVLLSFERSLILAKMSFKGSLARLRHDLAKEVVVALCSLILLSLFIFIFSDFLGNRIAQIPESSRQVIGLVGMMPIVIWYSRKLLSSVAIELMSTARRLGESPQVVKSSSIMILMAHTAVALIPISTTLAYLLPGSFITNLVCLLAISATAAVLGDTLPKRSWLPAPRGWQISLTNKLGTIINFRLRQLTKGNEFFAKTIYVQIALSMFAAALHAFTPVRYHPALFLLNSTAGFILSCLLSLQLHEDLKLAWAERTIGISHDEIVSAYQWLSRLFMLVLLVANAVAFAAASAIHGNAEHNWIQLMQSTLAGCTYLAITPGMLFQIDSRKPASQIALLFIMGLFISTAVLAWLPAFLLVPLLNYYTIPYQRGRFYRA